MLGAVWYPTQAAASEQPLAFSTQTVAPDAALHGGSHPLVVISLGSDVAPPSHYDTALALAQAGFVVVAMGHPGDNYATDLAEWARTVHAVIDYMLAAWPGHDAIDASRIGLFGFSSGGFTALVSIGGVPDLSKVAPYCAVHTQTGTCATVKAYPVTDPIRPADWIADSRIKAAVIAAPTLGFAFAPSGLRLVHVPIQLWQAGNDHILPAPDYVEPVWDALPRKPEYHLVAGANHFDFLAPCSVALARFDPVGCQEHGDFDRQAFHDDFNAQVVRFFGQALH